MFANPNCPTIPKNRQYWPPDGVTLVMANWLKEAKSDRIPMACAFVWVLQPLGPIGGDVGPCSSGDFTVRAHYVIQFRSRSRPRNYLARREQVRLFLMVGLLMAVVGVAFEARNPEHYRWIWDWGRGATSVGEDVDTRVTPTGSVPDDTFVFPRPGESLDEPAQAIAGPLTEADLASVCDDEPFRVGEQAAWFKLLDQLQETDSATLSEQSTGPVTFIQLYRQPREYRGELITTSGTLRRSEQIAAPKNDLGIESYYRTWLSPKDNPTNPIVVYTLTVPDGFPEGMTIEEPVELDGYFFKRWPYAASDTVRSAPVVLAKSLRWVAAPPEKSAPPMSPTTIVAVAVAVALGVALLAWWQTKHKRNGEPVPGLFAEPVTGEAAHDGTKHLRLVTEPERGGER